jgi:hypothetical protein
MDIEFIDFGSLDCFDVCCVTKEETGLHYDIYFDSVGAEGKRASRPSVFVTVEDKVIKIQVTSELDIQLEFNAPEINEISSWINENKDYILMHCNKEITDRELLNFVLRNN